MKKMINGKMYVQIKDLDFIFQKGSFSIPQSIYRVSLYETIHMTPETANDYIEFDQQSDIEFFKQLDCIVDYDEYKKMSNRKYKKFLASSYKLLTSLIEKKDSASKLLEKADYQRKIDLECQKVIGVRESRLTYKEEKSPVIKKTIKNLFSK